MFSVSAANGPGGGTDSAADTTVRDVLPADERRGPDLPPFGSCDNGPHGALLTHRRPVGSHRPAPSWH